MGIKIHPTAVVDAGAKIGEGTSVWHYSHICSGAIVGKSCSLAQNVLVADNAIIGNVLKCRTMLRSTVALLLKMKFF